MDILWDVFAFHDHLHVAELMIHPEPHLQEQTRRSLLLQPGRNFATTFPCQSGRASSVDPEC